MDVSRRQFVNSALLLALLGPLKGCKKPVVGICPFGDQYSDPSSRLVVDVHAHIFNATDLQIKDFANLVATREMGGLGKVARLLTGPLQKFTWATAPTVAEELAELERIRPYIENCDEGRVTTSLLALRDQKYEQGQSEIEVAARSQMSEVAISPRDLDGPVGALSSELSDFRRLTELPSSYDQLFTPELSAPTGSPLPDSSPAAVTFRSAIKFIVEMLQYRYVSIYNYLNTYNRDAGPKIDLMLPAMVDYDWWLSKGAPTKSSLPDQAALMKEIAILTGGRVHALVPFDPFRQVVVDMNQDAGFSPIDLVKKAVTEYGAVGVKLYSPMGFAPYGNQAVGEASPDFWKRDWLTDIAESPTFGQKLDTAMAKLFTYCADEGVPIMGHSNQSNGPTDDFEALTGPDFWKNAVDEFPNTRLSFGHFGGAGSQTADGSSPIEGFLNLLAEDQAAGSGRLAADASYFSNVIDDPDRLRDVMKFVYEYGADDPPAVARLMYGADWKMLVAESGSEHYLADFSRVVDELEDSMSIPALGDNFLGANAAAFLGLKQNQATRRRLEKFYDAADFRDAPTWMGKVDALG